MNRNTLELAEAVEIVVARTGHVRLRDLCDPAHPDYHPGAPERVIRWAMGLPLAGPDAGPRPDPATPNPPPVEFTPSRRPDAARPAPRRPSPPRELVVSAYAEDLGWLSQVPMPVMLYMKGPSRFPGIASAYLPNVGREAHGYLTHIVEHWDTLADLTIFAQGDSYPVHSPYFLDAIAVPDLGFSSLTPWYKCDFPGPEAKAHDRLEQLGPHVVRYGDADWFGNRSPEANAAWLEAAWSAVFACHRPRPWWFGYAATYAVPRSHIHARPRRFWAELRDRLAEDSFRVETDAPHGQLTAWVLETLWWYLFQSPAEYPHCDLGPNPVEAHRAKVAMVKACPSWSKAGCGCSAGLCASGKGQLGTGVVSFGECFECLGL